MAVEAWWLLGLGGLLAGVLSGALGVGGGVVSVPLAVALGYAPVQAVAASNLAMAAAALAGSADNWRRGELDWRCVAALGLPAIAAAQLGVLAADRLPAAGLLGIFVSFLALNPLLGRWRRRVTRQGRRTSQPRTPPALARALTGGAGGLMAGGLGVGGGIVMTPLQVLLLGATVPVAVRTSLGAIAVNAIAASAGHAWQGNMPWGMGASLSLGGVLGAPLGARLLPKLYAVLLKASLRLLPWLLALQLRWQLWRRPSGPQRQSGPRLRGPLGRS